MIMSSKTNFAPLGAVSSKSSWIQRSFAWLSMACMLLTFSFFGTQDAHAAYGEEVKAQVTATGAAGAGTFVSDVIMILKNSTADTTGAFLLQGVGSPVLDATSVVIDWAENAQSEILPPTSYQSRNIGTNNVAFIVDAQGVKPGLYSFEIGRTANDNKGVHARVLVVPATAGIAPRVAVTASSASPSTVTVAFLNSATPIDVATGANVQMPVAIGASVTWFAGPSDGATNLNNFTNIKSYAYLASSTNAGSASTPQYTVTYQDDWTDSSPTSAGPFVARDGSSNTTIAANLPGWFEFHTVANPTDTNNNYIYGNLKITAFTSPNDTAEVMAMCQNTVNAIAPLVSNAKYVIGINDLTKGSASFNTTHVNNAKYIGFVGSVGSTVAPVLHTASFKTSATVTAVGAIGTWLTTETAYFAPFTPTPGPGATLNRGYVYLTLKTDTSTIPAGKYGVYTAAVGINTTPPTTATYTLVYSPSAQSATVLMNKGDSLTGPRTTPVAPLSAADVGTTAAVYVIFDATAAPNGVTPAASYSAVSTGLTGIPWTKQTVTLTTATQGITAAATSQKIGFYRTPVLPAASVSTNGVYVASFFVVDAVDSTLPPVGSATNYNPIFSYVKNGTTKTDFLTTNTLDAQNYFVGTWNKAASNWNYSLATYRGTQLQLGMVNSTGNSIVFPPTGGLRFRDFVGTSITAVLAPLPTSLQGYLPSTKNLNSSANGRVTFVDGDVTTLNGQPNGVYTTTATLGTAKYAYRYAVVNEATITPDKVYVYKGVNAGAIATTVTGTTNQYVIDFGEYNTTTDVPITSGTAAVIFNPTSQVNAPTYNFSAGGSGWMTVSAMGSTSATAAAQQPYIPINGSGFLQFSPNNATIKDLPVGIYTATATFSPNGGTTTYTVIFKLTVVTEPLKGGFYFNTPSTDTVLTSNTAGLTTLPGSIAMVQASTGWNYPTGVTAYNFFIVNKQNTGSPVVFGDGTTITLRTSSIAWASILPVFDVTFMGSNGTTVTYTAVADLSTPSPKIAPNGTGRITLKPKAGNNFDAWNPHLFFKMSDVLQSNATPLTGFPVAANTNVTLAAGGANATRSATNFATSQTDYKTSDSWLNGVLISTPHASAANLKETDLITSGSISVSFPNGSPLKTTVYGTSNKHLFGDPFMIYDIAPNSASSGSYSATPTLTSTTLTLSFTNTAYNTTIPYQIPVVGTTRFSSAAKVNWYGTVGNPFPTVQATENIFLNNTGAPTPLAATSLAITNNGTQIAYKIVGPRGASTVAVDENGFAKVYFNPGGTLASSNRAIDSISTTTAPVFKKDYQFYLGATPGISPTSMTFVVPSNITSWDQIATQTLGASQHFGSITTDYFPALQTATGWLKSNTLNSGPLGAPAEFWNFNANTGGAPPVFADFLTTNGAVANAVAKFGTAANAPTLAAKLVVVSEDAATMAIYPGPGQYLWQFPRSENNISAPTTTAYSDIPSSISVLTATASGAVTPSTISGPSIISSRMPVAGAGAYGIVTSGTLTISEIGFVTSSTLTAMTYPVPSSQKGIKTQTLQIQAGGSSVLPTAPYHYIFKAALPGVYTQYTSGSAIVVSTAGVMSPAVDDMKVFIADKASTWTVAFTDGPTSAISWLELLDSSLTSVTQGNWSGGTTDFDGVYSLSIPSTKVPPMGAYNIRMRVTYWSDDTIPVPVFMDDTWFTFTVIGALPPPSAQDFYKFEYNTNTNNYTRNDFDSTIGKITVFSIGTVFTSKTVTSALNNQWIHSTVRANSTDTSFTFTNTVNTLNKAGVDTNTLILSDDYTTYSYPAVYITPGIMLTSGAGTTSTLYNGSAFETTTTFKLVRSGFGTASKLDQELWNITVAETTTTTPIPWLEVRYSDLDPTNEGKWLDPVNYGDPGFAEQFITSGTLSLYVNDPSQVPVGTTAATITATYGSSGLVYHLNVLITTPGAIPPPAFQDYYKVEYNTITGTYLRNDFRNAVPTTISAITVFTTNTSVPFVSKVVPSTVGGNTWINSTVRANSAATSFTFANRAVAVRTAGVDTNTLELGDGKTTYSYPVVYITPGIMLTAGTTSTLYNGTAFVSAPEFKLVRSGFARTLNNQSPWTVALKKASDGSSVDSWLKLAYSDNPTSGQWNSNNLTYGDPGFIDQFFTTGTLSLSLVPGGTIPVGTTNLILTATYGTAANQLVFEQPIAISNPNVVVTRNSVVIPSTYDLNVIDAGTGGFVINVLSADASDSVSKMLNLEYTAEGVVGGPQFFNLVSTDPSTDTSSISGNFKWTYTINRSAIESWILAHPNDRSFSVTINLKNSFDGTTVLPTGRTSAFDNFQQVITVRVSGIIPDPSYIVLGPTDMGTTESILTMYPGVSNGLYKVSYSTTTLTNGIILEPGTRRGSFTSNNPTSVTFTVNGALINTSGTVYTIPVTVELQDISTTQSYHYDLKINRAIAFNKTSTVSLTDAQIATYQAYDTFKLATTAYNYTTNPLDSTVTLIVEYVSGPPTITAGNICDFLSSPQKLGPDRSGNLYLQLNPTNLAAAGYGTYVLQPYLVMADGITPLPVSHKLAQYTIGGSGLLPTMSFTYTLGAGNYSPTAWDQTYAKGYSFSAYEAIDPFIVQPSSNTATGALTFTNFTLNGQSVAPWVQFGDSSNTSNTVTVPTGGVLATYPVTLLSPPLSSTIDGIQYRAELHIPATLVGSAKVVVYTLTIGQAGGDIINPVSAEIGGYIADDASFKIVRQSAGFNNSSFIVVPENAKTYLNTSVSSPLSDYIKLTPSQMMTSGQFVPSTGAELKVGLNLDKIKTLSASSILGTITFQFYDENGVPRRAVTRDFTLIVSASAHALQGSSDKGIQNLYAFGNASFNGSYVFTDSIDTFMTTGTNPTTNLPLSLLSTVYTPADKNNWLLSTLNLGGSVTYNIDSAVADQYKAGSYSAKLTYIDGSSSAISLSRTITLTVNKSVSDVKAPGFAGYINESGWQSTDWNNGGNAFEVARTDAGDVLTSISLSLDGGATYAQTNVMTASQPVLPLTSGVPHTVLLLVDKDKIQQYANNATLDFKVAFEFNNASGAKDVFYRTFKFNNSFTYTPSDLTYSAVISPSTPLGTWTPGNRITFSGIYSAVPSFGTTPPPDWVTASYNANDVTLSIVSGKIPAGQTRSTTLDIEIYGSAGVSIGHITRSVTAVSLEKDGFYASDTVVGDTFMAGTRPIGTVAINGPAYTISNTTNTISSVYVDIVADASTPVDAVSSKLIPMFNGSASNTIALAQGSSGQLAIGTIASNADDGINALAASNVPYKFIVIFKNGSASGAELGRKTFTLTVLPKVTGQGGIIYQAEGVKGNASSFNTPAGSAKFVVTKFNSGSYPYSIEGIPSWLTVTPSQGSITALSTPTLTLSVNGPEAAKITQIGAIEIPLYIKVRPNDYTTDGITVPFGTVRLTVLSGRITPDSSALAATVDSGNFTSVKFAGGTAPDPTRAITIYNDGSTQAYFQWKSTAASNAWLIGGTDLNTAATIPVGQWSEAVAIPANGFKQIYLQIINGSATLAAGDYTTNIDIQMLDANRANVGSIVTRTVKLTVNRSVPGQFVIGGTPASNSWTKTVNFGDPLTTNTYYNNTSGGNVWFKQNSVPAWVTSTVPAALTGPIANNTQSSVYTLTYTTPADGARFGKFTGNLVIDYNFAADGSVAQPSTNTPIDLTILPFGSGMANLLPDATGRTIPVAITYGATVAPAMPNQAIAVPQGGVVTVGTTPVYDPATPSWLVVTDTNPAAVKVTLQNFSTLLAGTYKASVPVTISGGAGGVPFTSNLIYVLTVSPNMNAVKITSDEFRASGAYKAAGSTFNISVGSSIYIDNKSGTNIEIDLKDSSPNFVLNAGSWPYVGVVATGTSVTVAHGQQYPIQLKVADTVQSLAVGSHSPTLNPTSFKVFIKGGAQIPVAALTMTAAKEIITINSNLSGVSVTPSKLRPAGSELAADFNNMNDDNVSFYWVNNAEPRWFSITNSIGQPTSFTVTVQNATGAPTISVDNVTFMASLIGSLAVDAVQPIYVKLNQSGTFTLQFVVGGNSFTRTVDVTHNNITVRPNVESKDGVLNIYGYYDQPSNFTSVGNVRRDTFVFQNYTVDSLVVKATILWNGKPTNAQWVTFAGSEEVQVNGMGSGSFVFTPISSASSKLTAPESVNVRFDAVNLTGTVVATATRKISADIKQEPAIYFNADCFKPNTDTTFTLGNTGTVITPAGNEASYFVKANAADADRFQQLGVNVKYLENAGFDHEWLEAVATNGYNAVIPSAGVDILPISNWTVSGDVLTTYTMKFSVKESVAKTMTPGKYQAQVTATTYMNGSFVGSGSRIITLVVVQTNNVMITPEPFAYDAGATPPILNYDAIFRGAYQSSNYPETVGGNLTYHLSTVTNNSNAAATVKVTTPDWLTAEAVGASGTMVLPAVLLKANNLNINISVNPLKANALAVGDYTGEVTVTALDATGVSELNKKVYHVKLTVEASGNIDNNDITPVDNTAYYVKALLDGTTYASFDTAWDKKIYIQNNTGNVATVNVTMLSPAQGEPDWIGLDGGNGDKSMAVGANSISFTLKPFAKTGVDATKAYSRIVTFKVGTQTYTRTITMTLAGEYELNPQGSMVAEGILNEADSFRFVDTNSSFNSSSRVYTAVNNTAKAMQLILSVNPTTATSWLIIDPSSLSTSLAPKTSKNVTVQLNTAVLATMPTGIYKVTMSFKFDGAADPNTVTRDITMTIRKAVDVLPDPGLTGRVVLGSDNVYWDNTTNANHNVAMFDIFDRPTVFDTPVVNVTDINESPMWISGTQITYVTPTETNPLYNKWTCQVQINSSVIRSLEKKDYTKTLVFTASGRTFTRTVKLSVTDAGTITAETMLFTGPIHKGPFVTTTNTNSYAVTITNNSSVSQDWALSVVSANPTDPTVLPAAWLVATGNGQLQQYSTIKPTVSINAEVAKTLVEGIYAGMVQAKIGNIVKTFPVSLTITPTFKIIPDTIVAWTVKGTTVNEFITTDTITIENSTANQVSWQQLTTLPDWVELSVSSGTLAANNGSQQIKVTIHPDKVPATTPVNTDLVADLEFFFAGGISSDQLTYPAKVILGVRDVIAAGPSNIAFTGYFASTNYPDVYEISVNNNKIPSTPTTYTVTKNVDWFSVFSSSTNITPTSNTASSVQNLPGSTVVKLSAKIMPDRAKLMAVGVYTGTAIFDFGTGAQSIVTVTLTIEDPVSLLTDSEQLASMNYGDRDSIKFNANNTKRMVYTIQSESNQDVDVIVSTVWEAGVPQWLNLLNDAGTTSSGYLTFTLPAGQTKDITAALGIAVQDNVKLIEVGETTGALKFQFGVNGPVTYSKNITLTVYPTPINSESVPMMINSNPISSTTPIDIHGYEGRGSEFTFKSSTAVRQRLGLLSLMNETGRTITWKLDTTAEPFSTWLQGSPVSGTLANFADAMITLQFNDSAASAIVKGTYTGNLVFTIVDDQNTSAVVNAPYKLVVEASTYLEPASKLGYMPMFDATKLVWTNDATTNTFSVWNKSGEVIHVDTVSFTPTAGQPVWLAIASSPAGNNIANDNSAKLFFTLDANVMNEFKDYTGVLTVNATGVSSGKAVVLNANVQVSIRSTYSITMPSGVTEIKAESQYARSEATAAFTTPASGKFVEITTVNFATDTPGNPLVAPGSIPTWLKADPAVPTKQATGVYLWKFTFDNTVIDANYPVGTNTYPPITFGFDGTQILSANASLTVKQADLLPTLISPVSLTFSAYEGRGVAINTGVFKVANNTGGTVNFSVDAPSVPWLTLDNRASSTSYPVTNGTTETISLKLVDAEAIKFATNQTTVIKIRLTDALGNPFGPYEYAITLQIISPYTATSVSGSVVTAHGFKGVPSSFSFSDSMTSVTQLKIVNGSGPVAGQTTVTVNPPVLSVTPSTLSGTADRVTVGILDAISTLNSGDTTVTFSFTTVEVNAGTTYTYQYTYPLVVKALPSYDVSEYMINLMGYEGDRTSFEFDWTADDGTSGTGKTVTIVLNNDNPTQAVPWRLKNAAIPSWMKLVQYNASDIQQAKSTEGVIPPNSYVYVVISYTDAVANVDPMADRNGVIPAANFKLEFDFALDGIVDVTSNVDLTVKEKGLQVYPTTGLKFENVYGSGVFTATAVDIFNGDPGLTTTDSLTLRNPGDTTMTLSYAGSSTSWLSLLSTPPTSLGTGANNEVVLKVAIDPIAVEALDASTHTATLTFVGDGVSVTGLVTLVISQGGGFTIDPDDSAPTVITKVYGVDDYDPASFDITINNNTGAPAVFDIAMNPAVAWLDAPSTFGVAVSEAFPVTVVTSEADQLTSGVYSTVIEVSFGTQTETHTVELVVSPNSGGLSIDPATMIESTIFKQFASDKTVDALIANVSGMAQDIETTVTFDSEDAAWLTAGTIGSVIANDSTMTLSVTFIADEINTMTAGTYTATVKVTSVPPAAVATLAVTLTINPDLTAIVVTPSLLSASGMEDSASYNYIGDDHFTIINESGQALTLNLVSDSTSGLTLDLPSTITVAHSDSFDLKPVFSAATDALTVGSYSATITFSLDTFLATRDVNLEITPAIFKVDPKAPLAVNTVYGSDVVTGDQIAFTVSATTGTTITVTSSETWLDIPTTLTAFVDAGTTWGLDLNDLLNADGLTSGVYTANVTFTGEGVVDYIVRQVVLTVSPDFSKLATEKYSDELHASGVALSGDYTFNDDAQTTFTITNASGGDYTPSLTVYNNGQLVTDLSNYWVSISGYDVPTGTTGTVALALNTQAITDMSDVADSFTASLVLEQAGYTTITRTVVLTLEGPEALLIIDANDAEADAIYGSNIGFTSGTQKTLMVINGLAVDVPTTVTIDSGIPGIDWLTVAPGTALTVAPGTTETLTLTAVNSTETRSITPGTYTATVAIQALAVSKTISVTLTVYASDVFEVTPDETATFSGYASSGNFSPSSKSYGVTYMTGTTATLNLSVVSDTPWVTALFNNGLTTAVAGPSASLPVDVMLDSEAANQLTSGTYTATIVFASNDLSTTIGRQATLTVLDSGITIEPFGAMVATGVYQSGSYVFEVPGFTVTSDHAAAVSITANNADWLKLDPVSFSLTADTPATVSATIDATKADQLLAGDYSTTVKFMIGAIEFHREVTLQVKADLSKITTDLAIDYANAAGVHNRPNTFGFTSANAFVLTNFGGSDLALTVASPDWVLLNTYTVNNGTSATIIMDVDKDVAALYEPGTHASTLVISDAASGFSINLNATLEVKYPGYVVVNPTDPFKAVVQTSNTLTTKSAHYVVSNAAHDDLNWTAALSDSTVDWVTFTPVSGALTASQSTTFTVSFTDKVKDLSQGDYAVQILLTNTDYTTNQEAIEVSLIVRDSLASIIEIDPASRLEVLIQEGSMVEDLYLTTVMNKGYSDLNWTASVVYDDPLTTGWLDVAPTSGSAPFDQETVTSTDSPTTVSFTVNTVSLPIGTYRAKIVYTNADDLSNFVERPVLLDVVEKFGIAISPQKGYTILTTLNTMPADTTYTFTMINYIAHEIEWNVEIVPNNGDTVIPTWLEIVSGQTGHLLVDADGYVVIGLTDEVLTMPEGTYTARLRFGNNKNSTKEYRTITLSISSATENAASNAWIMME